MREINDGGAAFPGENDSDNYNWVNRGMTLRDWFAGHAMNAMMNAMLRVRDDVDGHPMSNNGSVWISPGRAEWVAKISYQQADAMIKAGKQGGAE